MQSLRFFSALMFLLPIHAAQAESGSSEQARTSKTVQVGVHGGGNGGGTHVGLFLPGDNRLDLSYSMTSFDFFGLTYKQKIYSLELQSFVGNSFYYAVGVTQRELEITIRDYYVEDTGAFTTHLSSRAQSFGPHLVIGNEWQWDYFSTGLPLLGGWYNLRRTG